MKNISSFLVRDYIYLALYGIAVVSISHYCIFISSSTFHQLYFPLASPSCISILIEGGSEFALPVASFLLSRIGCLPLLISPAETVPSFTQPDHIPHSKSTCWLFLTFLQQDPTLQLCCAGSSDNYLSFTLWSYLFHFLHVFKWSSFCLFSPSSAIFIFYVTCSPISFSQQYALFSIMIKQSTSDFVWFQVLPLHPSFFQCFRLKSVL